jgi:hypothetical protein
VTAGPRAVVAVVPRRAHAERATLFAALEEALDVRIVGCDEGAWDGADGVVRLGAPRGDRVPAVALLEAEAAERAAGAPATVVLASDAALDRRLHGAVLHDAHAAPLDAGAAAHETVLAHAGDGAAWTRCGDLERVRCLPDELAAGEALRDRLAPGRSLALLALVHFLRRVAGPRGWQPPPLRAAFILDDPNLHWPRYGHVRYPDLARAAAAGGYHVAMATIPLDGWLVHPTAARIFRDHAAQLSLLIHGNDHTGPELGRPATEAQAAAVAGQALRRIAAFERRCRVPVSRIMAPPHESLSEPLLGALAGCGYEGVSTTRPYPWIATPGRPWLARPDGAGPLAGWPVADVVGGALPVLLRQAFSHPREDLVLRAFLGQALVMYGHHDDLAGGSGTLDDLAAGVQALGDVRWGAMDALARGGVESRRAGDTLQLRLHARVARLELPAWAARVEVTAPSGGLDLRDTTLSIGQRRIAVPPGEAIPIDATGAATITVGAERRADDGTEPPRRLWPIARRVAAESRDRLAPVLAQARRVSRTPAR